MAAALNSVDSLGTTELALVVHNVAEEVVQIRKYYAYFWLPRDAREQAHADPPPPCSCGASSWVALARVAASDGTLGGAVRCKLCDRVRDIVFDPFTGPTGVTAAAVSPWETPSSAEADLRWFFSEADGELGAHSSWESKVQLANFGNDSTPAIEVIMGEATAATPNERKIWAASRWARIREVLRALERRHQAILEACFMVRRQRTDVMVAVGPEAEPVVAYLIASGQVDEKDLEDAEKREKVKTEALAARVAALGAYVAARALSREVEPVRRRKGQDKAQASATGAGKRRLVPVVAPISKWTPPVDA